MLLEKLIDNTFFFQAGLNPLHSEKERQDKDFVSKFERINN